jgi:3-(3-hydroxy-phenyl)propionate hydroxylase
MSTTDLTPTTIRRVTADVAIVGYGPVGATAANFFGALGLSVAVIERESSPYARARAISTDEEVLRTWQRVGLAERLKQDMLAGRALEFVDSDGKSFIDLKPVPRGSGHPPQLFIYQPAVELVLREGVERYGNVEVLLEHELRGLRQLTNGVELEVADLRGCETVTVFAQYVLACDGGSSPTRGLLDIGFEGTSYEDPWLVIDTKMKQPWPHHDYLRFHCDPVRPAVDCPTPLDHHRWEFPVLPGEDRDEIASEESVWRLLSRYGVGPEHVEILRRVVYVHHVRFAKRWRKGRVFLLGDAAHVMPPWIGQGMAAGVRDAGNLCWKVAAVIRGEMRSELLDTYEQERAAHVREVTKRAVFFGKVITERRRQRTLVRNAVFTAGMKLPLFGSYMREARWFPAARYPDGLILEQPGVRAVGEAIPQPWVLDEAGERVLLDDTLGHGWAVLRRAGVEPDSLASWVKAGARLLEVRSASQQPGPGAIVDVDGVLEGWLRDRRAGVVVVRPDRFTYTAARAGAPLAFPPFPLHLERHAVTA